MVIRMRHNRSQRGSTRSHHAIKTGDLAKCANCGTKKLNHRVCINCGFYKGKMVIDVLAKTAKRNKKKEAEAKK